MSDEEEEIPAHIQAWQEESWTFHGGSHESYEIPIYVDYCRFIDGIHYPGYYCPHNELGEDVGYQAIPRDDYPVEF